MDSYLAYRKANKISSQPIPTGPSSYLWAEFSCRLEWKTFFHLPHSTWFEQLQSQQACETHLVSKPTMNLCWVFAIKLYQGQWVLVSMVFHNPCKNVLMLFLKCKDCTSRRCASTISGTMSSSAHTYHSLNLMKCLGKFLNMIIWSSSRDTQSPMQVWY